MTPLVSFVIPSHNSAEYLGAAVESVRNQTHKELEIIVINDGSTDSTMAYLGWLARVEPRARILTNTKKMGRSFSRNFGNSVARGQYIFVLDADDEATPKRVELTLPLFRRADFVHGGAIRMSPMNAEVGQMVTDKFDLKKTISDPLRQTFIVHSTVAYRKQFADDFQYRDGEASEFGIDDWDQQIRAALLGAKFDFTPNTLAYYRDNENGISNRRDPSEVLSAKRRLIPALFEEAVSAK